MDALTPDRFLARLKGGRPQVDGIGARPEGRLLWMHVPPDRVPPPIGGVCARLKPELGALSVLVTGAPLPESGCGDALVAAVPETVRQMEAFLGHWRPDAALWVGTVESPLLLDATFAASIPTTLIDAEEPADILGRARRVQRLLYSRFVRIFACDAAAADSLRRIGPSVPPIEVTGPLTRLDPPLRASEGDREEFAVTIGSRPVWLAACPPQEELDIVLAAHVAAQRGSHRLLLLLVPTRETDAAALALRLRDDGWRLACRAEEALPDDTVEIYLAESDEELGLWYRLAPVTYIGGSLTSGARCAPMDAARLGSAVIAGAEGGSHVDALEAMDEVGALRRIADPPGLARAVTDLIAPDRAALLAHRAWDVVTYGAEVEERLATHLRTLIGRAVV